MPRPPGGASPTRRFVALSLLVVGVLAVGGGAAWQLQLLPGSQIVLPAPVAFHGTPGVRDVRTPLSKLAQPSNRTDATLAQLPQPPPEPQAAPADAASAALPTPGVAQRLVISSIGLDTPVIAGGIQPNASGQPEWETVPFVAVHYAQLTALVGAPGNAVIAGHVSTRQMGNVFIDLYRVELGDEIEVWDESGAVHDFTVTGVQLVPPSDTSVMDETPDPTLTLMTCGGTFDPVHREFSDRLVVSATLA